VTEEQSLTSAVDDTYDADDIIEKVTKEKLPVMEIFGPTMQGEGWMAGRQSHFVRFGGCSYRCVWCDSLHAVDPQSVHANARWMTTRTVVDTLTTKGGSRACEWVTLSGGDPAVWDLRRLIRGLKKEGYKVAIETQGAYCRKWMSELDLITLSPKPPSSGMAHMLDGGALNMIYALSPLVEVVTKIVIADYKDLSWASDYVKEYVPPARPLYLSALTPVPHPKESKNATRIRVCLSYTHLVKKVLESQDFKHAILLPQLHVLVWGHQLSV
jgi:7-carboxy-7-deazaguanine synthase